MTRQVFCTGCGKVLPVSPTDAGGRVVCPACGAIAIAPPPPLRERPRTAGMGRPLAGPAQVEEDTPTPKQRRKLSPAAISIAALSLLLIGAAVIIGLLLRGRPPQQNWNALLPQIVQLKSEAEKLALEGDLAAAHAKYRQIEALAAGQRISDSAVWDLTERAKQDQDTLYRALLTEAQALAAERLTAATRPVRGIVEPPPYPYPFAQNVPLEQAPVAPATRPIDPGPLIPIAPATRQTVVANPLTRPAPPGLPVAAMPARSGSVRDDQVGAAIERGVAFLLSQFRADEVQVPNPPNDTHAQAVNALVVYALLSAGQATENPRLQIDHRDMKGLVDRMKDHLMNVPLRSDSTAPATYGRSLRIMALAIHNRPEDQATIKADLQYLLQSHRDGAFTYNDRLDRWDRPQTELPLGPGTRPGYYINPERESYLHNGEPRTPGTWPTPPETLFLRPKNERSRIDYLRDRLIERQQPPWDNSNSQYGLLGMHAGLEAGFDVPRQFYEQADAHWKRVILPTGEWGYNTRQNRGHYAMTAAGIASLLITHEVLEGGKFAQVGQDFGNKELARALAWLDQADHATNIDAPPVYYRGYSLHALATVGQLSGLKYLGGRDWYRVLAGHIVANQHANGAWGRSDTGVHAIIDTAYMVLFLSQGRHPVVAQKLRFDGTWNNRPHDLANLGRVVSRELGGPFNWLILPASRDVSAWLDSPLLLVSSHLPPRLTDDDVAKLRSYAQGGGLIVLHADGSSNRFNDYAAQLARRLFPYYILQELPAAHPLWSTQRVMKARSGVRGVSNGSRLLLVVLSGDPGGAWHTRDATRAVPWELGINLVAYSTGRNQARNRLDSPWLAEPAGAPLRTVKLARVKYSGNFDPEPDAWGRFARYLKAQAGWSIEARAVASNDVIPADVKLAHIVGTDAHKFTPSDIASLEAFVRTGGVLLVEDCGGSGAFADAMRAALVEKLGVQPAPIAAPHPLLRATHPGMEDCGALRLREFKAPKNPPRLELLEAGAGKVIISTGDLSSGMASSHAWGISGHHPDDALKLMKNLVIWVENK